MAQMEYEPVTLSTLGEGAGEELFARAWEQVLENILDPNFPATEVRKLNLVVSVKPNQDRTIGALEIVVGTKLPSGLSASSVCHIGREGGRATSAQRKARQLQIDWDETNRPRSIAPAADEKKGA